MLLSGTSSSLGRSLGIFRKLSGSRHSLAAWGSISSRSSPRCEGLKRTASRAPLPISFLPSHEECSAAWDVLSTYEDRDHLLANAFCWLRGVLFALRPCTSVQFREGAEWRARAQIARFFLRTLSDLRELVEELVAQVAVGAELWAKGADASGGVREGEGEGEGSSPRARRRGASSTSLLRMATWRAWERCCEGALKSTRREQMATHRCTSLLRCATSRS